MDPGIQLLLRIKVVQKPADAVIRNTLAGLIPLIGSQWKRRKLYRLLPPFDQCRSERVREQFLPEPFKIAIQMKPLHIRKLTGRSGILQTCPV